MIVPKIAFDRTVVCKIAGNAPLSPSPAHTSLTNVYKFLRTITFHKTYKCRSTLDHHSRYRRGCRVNSRFIKFHNQNRWDMVSCVRVPLCMCACPADILLKNTYGNRLVYTLPSSCSTYMKNAWAQMVSFVVRSSDLNFKNMEFRNSRRRPGTSEKFTFIFIFIFIIRRE